jgi:ABC-type Fe3+ transport system permease subunit
VTLPTPYVKPIRNNLGIAALIIVAVALVLLPLAAFVLGVTGVLTGPQQTKDTAGWAVLGGLVFAGFGLAVAGVVCLVGSVLAIIALTRKGYGKLTAIIALVLGAPTAVFGTLLLIPYLQIL